MALLFTIMTPPATRLSFHSSSTSSASAHSCLSIHPEGPEWGSRSRPTFYVLHLNDLQNLRFCNDPIAWQPKSHISYYIRAPFIFKERSVLIAKAASDIDSGDSDNLESDEDSLSVDNLPLESKLQLKLEQKMKMKLAKNIRLRRKKLVRKRRLRKKGRWPPSKLKKNKNV